MTTLPVQAPTRRCYVSQRELAEGERFYGILIEEAGRITRRDYSVEAWSGPPEGTIAHWLGRIPASQTPVKPTINDELLMECFEHLAEASEPEQLRFRYVLGLLLMRRKRLKFEDVRKEAGHEYLCLKHARTRQRYELLDPQLSEAELTAVQDEVFRILGWE